MFERYTEKARRVIFFARYEASQFGSPYIETEHLLLGLLREDKALTNRFLRSHASVEAIRKQIEAHSTVREKIATSVDLPLSNEGKRVLAYAAEEAERLGHKHIGTEHLLLGLMREEKCFAAEMLRERGLKLAKVREEVSRITEEKAPGQSSPGPALSSESALDLTEAAMTGQLEPVVGRGQELDAAIEILLGSRRKNPILIGEHGAGKTAIVEALAQRIADGEAPSPLADKRILAVDWQLAVRWAMDRAKFEEQLGSLAQAWEGANVILFLDDMQVLRAAASASVLPHSFGALGHDLLRGRIQCIGACTPSSYRELAQAYPWVPLCFRAVHVRPLDEEATLGVLQVRKRVYEKFHAVTYSDEALECAARNASRYLPETALPGKALELLDAAGARANLRQAALPEEVAEAQKRIKFIVHRMDSAIANHEFEKAKFYSDEERKERENLRVLQEEHHLDDPSLGIVGREDVEATIARWAAYPFCP